MRRRLSPDSLMLGVLWSNSILVCTKARDGHDVRHFFNCRARHRGIASPWQGMKTDPTQVANHWGPLAPLEAVSNQGCRCPNLGLSRATGICLGKGFELS